MGIGALLMLILFFPSITLADDIQQTILLLPDEGAECRYVRKLLEDAKSAYGIAKKTQKEGEAAASIEKLMAASEFSLNYVIDKTADVYAANKALEIKRGTVPQCAVDAKKEAEKQMDATMVLVQECHHRVSQLMKKK